MDQETQRERQEYMTALEDIKAVVYTKPGRTLIKYLFKSLDVGEMPEIGLAENILYDRLGFIRAGNSIFELVSEANPEQAALILAEIKKEKYERKIRDYFDEK